MFQFCYGIGYVRAHRLSPASYVLGTNEINENLDEEEDEISANGYGNPQKLGFSART